MPIADSTPAASACGRLRTGPLTFGQTTAASSTDPSSTSVGMSYTEHGDCTHARTHVR